MIQEVTFGTRKLKFKFGEVKEVPRVILTCIIIIIYLFKVDDIAKILHAQKIYIKLSNTRI